MISNRAFKIIQSHNKFFFTNIKNVRAIGAGKAAVIFKPSKRLFNFLTTAITSNSKMNFIWIKHCEPLLVFVVVIISYLIKLNQCLLDFYSNLLICLYRITLYQKINWLLSINTHFYFQQMSIFNFFKIILNRGKQLILNSAQSQNHLLLIIQYVSLYICNECVKIFQYPMCSSVIETITK